MSKTLYLPEHVAQKVKKEREEAQEADSTSVEGAYVDAKDRVLDPSLIDNPLTERLPQPTGWRVWLCLIKVQAKLMVVYISLMKYETVKR